jgi:hypothetical protein
VSAGGTVEVDLQSLVSDENAEDRHTFELTGGTSGRIEATVSGAVLEVRASDDAKGETTQLGLQVSDGENTVEGILPVQVLEHSKPPPVAVDDDEETTQGKPVTISVVSNDDDPLGKGLEASLLTPPAESMGSAQVVDAGRSIEFTPRSDFFGSASFVYSVTDETGDPARTSRATVRVSVIGYPSAPAAPTGQIASKLVDLRWGAPAANGAPITGYLVERRAEGGASADRFTTTTGATTYRDTAVTNGTKYQYRVLAVNDAVKSGDDERNWSEWSALLQPDQVPDAPDPPTLTFGDRSVRVDWDEPDNQGSEIAEYEVRLSGGFAASQTKAVLAPATVLDWTGLDNGTDYTFTVRARNDAEANGGWGEPSAASTESPAGRPQAVSTFDADRLDENTAVGGAVQLVWSAPTSAQINATELDRFELRWWRTSSSGTTAGTMTATPQETSKKIYNLQNGEEYVFELVAINKAPDKGVPKTSDTVTPAARPATMASPTVAPGAEAAGQTIRVTASLPANNGELVQSVEFDVGNGQWTRAPIGNPGAPAGSQIDFTIGPASGTSLNNGSTYQVRLRACNDVACGDPSGASEAVPYGVPGAPNVSAIPNGNSITWTWAQPTLNGGRFERYEVSLDGGGWTTHSGTTFSRNFACGESHGLQVRVVNDGGAGEKVGGVGSDSASTAVCPPPVTPPSATGLNVVLYGGGHVGVSYDVAWPSAQSEPITCRFYIDGALRFEAQCGTFASNQFFGIAVGDHTFYATATDRFGQTATTATISRFVT